MNQVGDAFLWRGIAVHQGHEVFKIGTDSILLGSWVSRLIPAAVRILDAGTGSGILALMMAQRYPNAFVSAFDIDENAVELAGYNFLQSGWQHRMAIFQRDILYQEIEETGRFDLVLSNPPFFKDGILPSEEYKSRARHLSVSIDGWMAGLTGRAQKNGHLCIIIPYSDAAAWIKSANERGFYVRDRIDVYSFLEDRQPLRSLLHFMSQLHQPQVSQLTIYAGQNEYTQSYEELTGIASAKQ